MKRHSSKIQEQLTNSISNRIKPQLIPDINSVNFENKTVIVLQIEHSQGPYYLNDKGLEKGVYVRIGNSNRLAGPEVINELNRVNNYTSFDKTPCDNLMESDLDLEHIKSIFSKHGRTVDTAKLISHL